MRMLTAHVPEGNRTVFFGLSGPAAKPSACKMGLEGSVSKRGIFRIEAGELKVG
jgi:hypothetical protein